MRRPPLTPDALAVARSPPQAELRVECELRTRTDVDGRLAGDIRHRRLPGAHPARRVQLLDVVGAGHGGDVQAVDGPHAVDEPGEEAGDGVVAGAGCGL